MHPPCMCFRTFVSVFRAFFCAFALLGVLTVPSGRVYAAGEAAIIVTETADELNNDGDCSLREAVIAANSNTAVDACAAGSGTDTIFLSAGTYTLSITGVDNTAQAGDLDILDHLVLKGSGKDLTILDAGQLNRVIHIAAVVTVEIESVTIMNGYAIGEGLLGGGGILNEGGILTLSNMVLSNNSTDKVGGGLDNTGSATLVDVTITGNHANAGGGIFNSGTLLLKSTTISSNSAGHTGGGLDNALNATLENVTISGNTIPQSPDASGGGVFSDGPLYLLNTTIAGNSTGLETRDSVRFKNSMVVNSLNGNNCTGTGSLVSEGYNLDSGSTCNFTVAGDLQATDPLLGPLADNQGLTLTHALLDGSPAIDAGDNLGCTKVDQRGAFRPADGTNDGIKTCDIGAYEFLGSFPQKVYLPSLSR